MGLLFCGLFVPFSILAFLLHALLSVYCNFVYVSVSKLKLLHLEVLLRTSHSQILAALNDLVLLQLFDIADKPLNVKYVALIQNIFYITHRQL